MADLKSSYMGVELKNPFIVGACSLTAHMEALKRIQDAGAAGVVIQSLFEEQIQLQAYRMEQELTKNDDFDAEIQDLFPDVQHGGPDEHLMWTRKSKEALDIPVFASLNCTNPETWAEWALKLEETGVDGLELNFFAIPIDFNQSAQEIEAEQIEALKRVKSKVKIPISVKLSPFYTSPLEIIKKMDEVGVEGFVLFNRLFHPSFNIEKETGQYPFNLSTSNDHQGKRLRLQRHPHRRGRRRGASGRCRRLSSGEHPLSQPNRCDRDDSQGSRGLDGPKRLYQARRLPR